eukprot:Hpha_TRINITY_DN26808_c0_g1::TRINITY_DN26808_c0_g1_i1::g.17378::m.17378
MRKFVVVGIFLTLGLVMLGAKTFRPEKAQELTSERQSVGSHSAQTQQPKLPLPRPGEGSLAVLGPHFGSTRYGGTQEKPIEGVAGYDRWLEWYFAPIREQGGSPRVVVLGEVSTREVELLRHYFGQVTIASGADVTASCASAEASAAGGAALTSLGGQKADIVLQYTASPHEQVRSFQHCFPTLVRPGGAWVVEGAAQGYGKAPSGGLKVRDFVGLGKVVADQVNRRYWDPSEKVELVQGSEDAETVFFGEDFVAITKTGPWEGYRQEGDPRTPYILGKLLLQRNHVEATKDADVLSGMEGQLPSWAYRSGSASLDWLNPPCAEKNVQGYSESSVLAACKEAGKEVYESTPFPMPPPKMMTGYPRPFMGSGERRTVTDKISNHGYDRWYTWYMEGFRTDPIRLLEIGMEGGGSAALWKSYFPNATLHGMDRLTSKLENAKRVVGAIKVYGGDQASIKDLKNMVATFGANSMDVIVDDGGHATTQQVHSFKVLFRDLLRPGGVYTVEDIETAFLGHHTMYDS